MILLNTRGFWQTRRRYAVSVSVCLCMLSFAAGCKGGKATGTSQPTSAQQSNPNAVSVTTSGGTSSAEDQTPQNAEDANLNCWVSVAKITYAFDGPPDGRLVSFECRNSNGKPVRIELATKALENGKIVTKDFGTVQLKMTGSGIGGISYFTGKQTMEAVQSSGQVVTNAMARYYMTPSQIRELRGHLGWADASASAGSSSSEASGGAGINTKGADGMTALLLAAEAGNSDSVKALIAAGADVNAKDKNGETALMKAVLLHPDTHKPDLKSVVALIAAHADVNAKDKNGFTALNNAVLIGDSGCAECAKALIAAGADVNVKAFNNRTPLMDAAEYHKNADCIKLLIAAGAARMPVSS